jgi:hypothetical protein
MYGHWESDFEKPQKVFGFIYKITHLYSGFYYFGQKQICNKIKRKPLKGKLRNRIEFKEGDWRRYTGSGVVSDHAKENSNDYKFEILFWTQSKTENNLLEAKLILEHLLEEKCLNQCFNFRFRIQKPLPEFV